MTKRDAGIRRWANEIAAFRRFAGLTQSDLAKAVGVERDQISSIENGRILPTWKVALAMTRELAVLELARKLDGFDHEKPFTELAAVSRLYGLDTARHMMEAAPDKDGIPGRG